MQNTPVMRREIALSPVEGVVSNTLGRRVVGEKGGSEGVVNLSFPPQKKEKQ